MNTLRNLMQRALLPVIALAASGCAANYPPIALEGRPADLAALVGNWSGTYVSDIVGEPGGSIAFNLEAGDYIAYGDVVMIRKGANQPFARYDPDRSTGYVLGAPSQNLTIAIVRAEDGTVRGELDPYWDFDRESEARTTFRGTVRGNVIAGTYETRFRGQIGRRTGTWRVWKAEPK